MRSKVSTMLPALLLLLFFSCNQGQYKDVKTPVAVPELDRAAVADSSVPSPTDGNDLYKSPSSGAPNKQPHIPSPSQPAANPDWDRKIVKTADLSIEVKNFPVFTDRLHRIVHENAGYIAQEAQTQTSAQIANTVSIKVPVNRFDDLVRQLPADSDRLTDKKVTSEDVSMEYVDTRSRLETKKDVRERYLDLLKQAHNMKDILAIQQEIDGIQEEMDAASGRINYLGHAAAFSTVNLKFYQVLDATVVENPQPSFPHKIKLSFLEGWEYLSTLALGLLSVWPLWLAAALGIAAWRRHQNRMNKKPV
jgi:hypothetical protein